MALENHVQEHVEVKLRLDGKQDRVIVLPNDLRVITYTTASKKPEITIACGPQSYVVNPDKKTEQVADLPHGITVEAIRENNRKIAVYVHRE